MSCSTSEPSPKGEFGRLFDPSRKNGMMVDMVRALSRVQVY